MPVVLVMKQTCSPTNGLPSTSWPCAMQMNDVMSPLTVPVAHLTSLWNLLRTVLRIATRCGRCPAAGYFGSRAIAVMSACPSSVDVLEVAAVQQVARQAQVVVEEVDARAEVDLRLAVLVGEDGDALRAARPQPEVRRGRVAVVGAQAGRRAAGAVARRSRPASSSRRGPNSR